MLNMMDSKHMFAQKPPRKLLQTMGDFKSGMSASKINTTTENFIKNKHGVHITEKVNSTTSRNRRKKEEMNGGVPNGHQTTQRAQALKRG